MSDIFYCSLEPDLINVIIMKYVYCANCQPVNSQDETDYGLHVAEFISDPLQNKEGDSN